MTAYGKNVDLMEVFLVDVESRLGTLLRDDTTNEETPAAGQQG
jgi:hypothetical protein